MYFVCHCRSERSEKSCALNVGRQMPNNSNPVIYNQMKRPFLLFLPFLLFIAGAFVACEEVEEAGKYDNWHPRNEAFY